MGSQFCQSAAQRCRGRMNVLVGRYIEEGASRGPPSPDSARAKIIRMGDRQRTTEPRRLGTSSRFVSSGLLEQQTVGSMALLSGNLFAEGAADVCDRPQRNCAINCPRVTWWPVGQLSPIRGQDIAKVTADHAIVGVPDPSSLVEQAHVHGSRMAFCFFFLAMSSLVLNLWRATLPSSAGSCSTSIKAFRDRQGRTVPYLIAMPRETPSLAVGKNVGSMRGCGTEDVTQGRVTGHGVPAR
jgi:hypothetical protein